MSRDNIVNITMFGGKGIFGGRETRKEVVISICPFADTCEALKAGRCAGDNPRLQDCINLQRKTVQGYTSRAMKHNEFVNKWKGHKKYGAVRNSLKRFEHIGDNQVRIELPHIDIERAIKGVNGYDSFKGGKAYYTTKDEIDVKAIENIMSAYSYALMGSENENTEEKMDMLLAIKEVDRKLYDDYIGATETVINYVGKRALLVTLKPDIEMKAGWYWDGEYMSRAKKGSVECGAIRGFAYGSDVRFKPAEDSIVEIEDNEWVDENTKFKL